MSCIRTITLACIFFRLYSPWNISKCNVVPTNFCKLKTVQAIYMKLHTVIEHNETMSHVQEP